MDPREFISSGIIESYLLGSATESEAREVIRMAGLYPEVRKEIDLVEKTLFEFAAKHKKTPPADVKQKILNVISAQGSGNGQVLPLYPEEIVGSRRREKLLSYLIAACIVLLIVSTFVNLMFYSKISRLQQQVSNFVSEKERLVFQVSNQQHQLELAQTQMNVAMNPRFTKVMLNGLEKSPKSLAAVYWNAETQEVYMHVYFLPNPMPDKQYQLWAIVDGKPVDAGMLELDPSSMMMHSMKPIGHPAAFAVTLEKMGGSPVPTMEDMYMLGKVSP